jgi:hypothetical protein
MLLQVIHRLAAPGNAVCSLSPRLSTGSTLLYPVLQFGNLFSYLQLVWWCGVMVKTDCWSHLSKLCTNSSRQVAEQQLSSWFYSLVRCLSASDEACTFKQGNYYPHWEGINATRCSSSSKQEEKQAAVNAWQAHHPLTTAGCRGKLEAGQGL